MEAATKAPPLEAAGDRSKVGSREPGPRAAPPASLEVILERARQGDASALPRLKQVLDDDPSLWRDCYQLVAMTEQAWLDKIAGRDLLLSQSVRRHVEQVKRDLAGPSASPLEQLLVERIAACWLGVHHAEMAEAFGDAGGGKVDGVRLKRLESANRRFLAATRALAVARRLTAGLRIEIQHTHDAPARPADGGGPVAERLRGLVRDAAATDAAVASGVGV